MKVYSGFLNCVIIFVLSYIYSTLYCAAHSTVQHTLLYSTHYSVEQLRSPDNEEGGGFTTYHDTVHLSDNKVWLNCSGGLNSVDSQRWALATIG
jgi:hypothetical protein